MEMINDRTKNDRKPQSTGVKNTDTISPTIIIVVIMTIMFLCTYYTFGGNRTNHFANDKNGLYAKSTATVVDLDKLETSAGFRQQRIVPTDEALSNSVGDQQSSRFRLAKDSWIGASESQSRVWSSMVWSRLTAHKTDPYSADRDREDVTDRTVELWDINSRSSRHNHWNTKSDEWAGHHTSYDLTFGLDHNYALRHAGANKIGEIGFRPHNSFDNGAYYGPILKSPWTTHYQPPLRPLPIYPVLSPQTKLSISKNEKLDWHTIGLLTLVKIGLIKLKLFGILKILFLLLFKLKLFLVAKFIKFHLLLKMSKFFKTLFVLPLLPILMILILSIILSAAMYLLPVQALNMIPASPAASSSMSNLLSSLLSNLPSVPARPALTKSATSSK